MPVHIDEVTADVEVDGDASAGAAPREAEDVREALCCWRTQARRDAQLAARVAASDFDD